MIKRANVVLINSFRSSSVQYVLLAAILLLATVLRFYKLGEWSFWTDEVITVNRAHQNLSQVFLDPINKNLKVTTLLMHFVFQFLGTSEWTARLVPTLIGIATIAILYFPVKRLFGPGVALMSGFLLAISPWHLFWSQNARFYSALLLFYSLAFFVFYFGLEQGSIKYFVVSIVFLAFATAERLLALVLLPVIVSYLALIIILPFGVFPRLRLKHLLLVLLPGLLIALFFAQEFVREPAKWQAIFGNRETAQPLEVLAQFVFYHVRLPMVLLAVCGAIYLLIAQPEKRRLTLFLIVGATVPVLVIIGASLFQFADPRYAYVSLVSWFILAGVAAVAVLTHAPQNAKLIAVGGLMFLTINPIRQDMAYYRYLKGDRPDWRSAFEFVEEQRQPDDWVLTNKVPLGEYYLGEDVIGTEEVDPEIIVRHDSRAWLVLKQNMVRVDPELQKWISENSQLLYDEFYVVVYFYDPTRPNITPVLSENPSQRSSSTRTSP